MADKEKKEKKTKRKPKYGLFSCVGYIYRLLWKYERGLVFVGVVTVPLSLCLSALSLYTPPAVLSALENSGRFSYIALVIMGLLLAKLLFDISDSVVRTKIECSAYRILNHMGYLWRARLRDRDWYLSLDPEIEKLNERAWEAVGSNHAAGVNFPMDFSDMLSRILKFLLFGSVISLLHPLVILLLVFGTALNAFMDKWRRNKNRENMDTRNALDKKINYCTYGISEDFQYAKDIRLYSMADSMRKRLNTVLRLRENEEKKRELRVVFVSAVSFFFVLLRDGAAYAFLIYKASKGEVDAASFVLYFSAITSMAGLMEGIFGIWSRVFDGALNISDFREAYEIPDRLNRGKGIPVPTVPFSIEFRNVSFQYPKGEKKVLDGISFRIEAGEKIALVGLNGVGKTTLTMLMCGILLPDEGEILLDGHPLTAYNRDEMYSLFGLVPQNYHLLPISIAGNIASTMDDEEIDREKLERCIKLAGFDEKIASLEKGADTLLNREINPDGIGLSGGEVQKLILARLLYKNPLCIILDEPTAALDPIAESRIYHRYNEITAHATAVFISHRLASTRFCDRIFLLDGACFAEVGTHDELMKRNGMYRELFDIQSKYYREEENHYEEA